jgi:UDP-N-acetylglucosamine 2-epimerase (non-hydrolysing)
MPLRRIVALPVRGPNFMKIAPIMAELRKWPALFEPTIVHTGQHYDAKLSHVFFHELGILRPDVNLNVGSSSHLIASRSNPPRQEAPTTKASSCSAIGGTVTR